MLLISVSFSSIYSWGLRGHRIVAHIGEKHLSEAARKQVKDLLNNDTLSKVANEADSARSQSKWKCASPLHYASVDDKETYLTSEKNPKGDIIRALYYFEDILRNKKSSRAHKIVALKWLVHLVGDVHQPLHVSRGCDRGGNSIAVHWFKEKTNLHKVWDSQFINSEELSYTEYATEIDKIDEKLKALWSDSTYLDWAAEAQTVRKQVYTCLGKDGCCPDVLGQCKKENTIFGSCDIKTGDKLPDLEYAYIESNRALLNRQLLKSGIRLAAVLNRVFADLPLSQKEKAARAELDALKTEQPNPVGECVEKALESTR